MSAPIRLDFAASTAKARAEINALSATVEKLQNKLISASGMDIFRGPGAGATTAIGRDAVAMKDAAYTLNQLGGRTVDLSTPVKQTEQLVHNINKGKISLDEYRKATGSASRVVTQQLALQRSELTNIRRDESGRRMADFKYGDVSQGVGGLEKLGMQAKVTGAALQAVGQNYIDMGKNMAFSARQLTISLTMPFVITSALSMKAYMDAAQSLTDIAKLYGDSSDGFSRSSEQIKREARDLAKSMSDTYAAAHADTYDHQKFYASQGLTGADLSGSTQQAVRLQMLGDVDTKDAQQAVTTLTNVFGVQTEQMGQYVDYMNMIEDSTTLTMQDFSEAMPKIGPIIKSFEQDPKEATKAMAEMLEAGKRGGIQSATEIANAWKSIYTKVARPTEQLKNTWEELGAKNGVAQSFMGIVTENGGDVMEIVKQISTLTQDWSDVDKGRLFSQLAGAQQVARMTTFAQQLANSNDTIKEINENFDSNPDMLSDNSRRQQDEIMASPEKRWAQFMNKLRDTGITIGEKVFGPIMTILEMSASFVERIINGLNELPKPVKAVLSVFGGFAVVLGPLVGVLGALIQVGGQITKLWGAGKNGIGNVINKATTGFSNKKLLTPEDRISQVTEDPTFQLKAELAYQQMMLGMEESTTKVTGTLSQFEAQIRKTTQAMINDPNNAVTTASARGLRPEDIERRKGILRAGALGSTGEARPRLQEVYVPPKPPKGRRSQDHLEMQQYKQAVARSQEAKRVHDLEMQAFNARQADARRVAARYKSFTDYMKNTPQERLDSNYEKSRVSPEETRAAQKRFETRRALDSAGMKRIASQVNVGDPRPAGPAIGTARTSRVQFSVMDDMAARAEVANNAQTVRDQVGYVNRDLAAAKNAQDSIKSGAKRVQQEKEIARLKAEQTRLNQVLKGSTAGIAQEAEKIKKSYEPTTVKNTGLLKPRGIMDSMRGTSGDHIMYPDNEDILTGFSKGDRTGLTKSGTFQASNKHVRRTVRRALKADPEAFEGYRGENQDYAETGVKMKNGTNLTMTPETWKMVDVQMNNAKTSSERLAATQARIKKDGEKYAQSISAAATGIGALAMMFGGDNAIAQGIGAATTAFGIAMSIAPKTAEKAIVGISSFAAEKFNTLGDIVGRSATEGAGGFGADLISGMKSKFIGFSGWLKANAGMLMGWGVALAAAIGVGVVAYKKLNESAREHREFLKASVEEAKNLADALGFHYIEPMQAQHQGDKVTDQDRETAAALMEIEGFQKRIDSIRGLSLDTSGDIDRLKLALNPAAIKILGSGGTEADVNKMVRSALVAAGADEATIEGFKLNLNVSNPSALIPESTMNDMKNNLIESRPRWEGILNEMTGSFGQLFSLSLKREDTEKMMDSANFIADSETAANSIVTGIKETVSAASDEAKPEVIARLMSIFEIPEGADKNTIDRINRVKAQVIQSMSEIDVDFNQDWAQPVLGASGTALETLIAGRGNAFESGEQAAEAYQKSLAELDAAGIKLSDSQKLTLNNLFRTGAGMQKLGDDAAGSEKRLNDFSQAVEEVPGPPLTLLQLVRQMAEVGQGTDKGRASIESFQAALNGLPDSFSKRWHISVDMSVPDEAGKVLAGMQREGAEKANDWGLDFAAKKMEEGHSRTVDGIRKAGDASLKALEGQQKAADKAMKAQEKALDGKHKAQSKALDNQIKEENKQFDKQQKAEKKQFDKQQKADKKLFDKDIDRQKKEFDDAWKQREESIATYYDSAKKYLEDQQQAEDKLDKSRERHAEAERKRQEMLHDLANKGIDINVAIAGGNLDEAAKLMNDANAASQQYYSEAGESISEAESEDRAAARDKRLSGMSAAEETANKFLAADKEKATEGFNLGIEGQQEAFGEKQEAEGETFDEKLNRQKEEFQLQLDARREQLQLQQEQEKEFLAAQREAEAEYFANKRAEIQSVTDASIQGAEAAHSARKESMALELELLKLNSGATEEEIAATTQNILETYKKYGVNLGHEGEKLQGGMIAHFQAGVDQAAQKMRNDDKWNDVGIKIGQMIQAGIEIGLEITPGEALQMSISGKMPKDLKDQMDRRNFQAISQGNKPMGRATGGPISGPGTGTSDSIPAMLSNGEHVLTAAEVRALGGHAAVERFRQQAMSGKIAAFATGGPVGSASGSMAGGGLTVTVAPTGIGGSGDGGVLSAVASDVSTIGTQFDQSLAQTAAPAWKLFGDSLIQVKNNSIDPTFEAMQIAMKAAAETTTNTTAGSMTPAWFTFGQNLLMVKDQMFDFAIQSMQSGMTSLANGTTEAIANQIIPAWTSGANHIQDMQTNVIDPMMQATQNVTTQTAENFGTAADMIGTGWGRVKELSAEPVRYTIGTVFNDGLVGMWNNVADALDLEKMSKHEFSFATGGVMPGYTPGRDVHHFSSPTGGKLHLSGGEAIMRPEWTKAVGGPRAVEQMNSAARRGNLSFHDGGVMPEAHVPTKNELRRYNTHADEWHANGGVWGDLSFAGGGLTPLSTPYNKRLWEIVRKISPGMALTSTELWKPSGARRDPHHGTGHAIDISDGGAQMPTAATSGVARFFHDEYGRAMTELIHWPLNGWQNIKNGAPLNYDSWTNSGHANHVHLATHTLLPDTGGELPMFPAFGGGAAGGMDPAILAAVEEFNTKKDQLKKDIEKHIGSGPDTIMKAIPGKIFTGITSGMEKKIQEAMPMAGLASLGAYGLDYEDHVREIIAAAKERGLPRHAAKIAIATALVESELRMYANTAVPESLSFAHEALGSDHDSVGLFQQRNNGAWGTTAQRMNARASAGLFYNKLVTIPGWQTMDPGAAAQKVQVSAYPAKYGPRMAEADMLINKVGGWDAIGVEGASPAPKPASGAAEGAKAGTKVGGKADWFDSGGIAQGVGYMEKRTLDPERVLSPQQTATFDKMVNVLDKSFGRKSIVHKDTVSSPITGQDFTRKVTDLDRQKYAGLRMSEKEYNPKTQEEIAKSLQPIFNAFQGFIQREVVPGVVGYATDLIQMKTDEERLEKVSTDIINGIENIYIPSNQEVNMVFGGTVYGDGHLVQIMEDYKRQILTEVRNISEEAARRVSGK